MTAISPTERERVLMDRLEQLQKDAATVAEALGARIEQLKAENKKLKRELCEESMCMD